MIHEVYFRPDLIAPCGINCRVCTGFLREKSKCPGCRRITVDTSKYRLNCRIRNCELLVQTSSGFCYGCSGFPCQRFKQLDKRYRTRYKTSLIGNLEDIKIKGIPAFLEDEKKKWTCPTCNGFISIHRGYCTTCVKT
jgi:hypothetical protein